MQRLAAQQLDGVGERVGEGALVAHVAAHGVADLAREDDVRDRRRHDPDHGDDVAHDALAEH